CNPAAETTAMVTAAHHATRPNDFRLGLFIFDLFQNLPSFLERGRGNFLQVASLLRGELIPGDSAIGGLVRHASVRDGSLPRADREYRKDVVLDRRGQFHPMGASVRRAQNRSEPAGDPTHLIGNSRAYEQISNNAAGLYRPGRTGILGTFDH